MKNHWSLGQARLGIIGGGHLACMLLPFAKQMNLTTSFIGHPDAPAAKLCDKFYAGDPTDENMILRLGREVDVLTIEIENVNTLALQVLQ